MQSKIKKKSISAYCAFFTEVGTKKNLEKMINLESLFVHKSLFFVLLFVIDVTRHEIKAKDNSEMFEEYIIRILFIR